MHERVPLKYKINIGFLFVSLFILLVGGVGYFNLQKVITKYDHVVKINLGNLEKMSEMRDSVRAQKGRVTLIVGLSKGHADKIQESMDKLQEEFVRYKKFDKEYQDIPFVEGEEKVYNKVDASWKNVKVKTDELLAAFKSEGDSDHVKELFFNGYQEATSDYFKAIDELMDFQSRETVKWSTQAAEVASLSMYITIFFMIAGFVASVILGIVLAQLISKKLTEAINELNKSAPELIESASSLGSMSQELSSCATEQAAAVQETASSLEEISAMVKKNSDHTGDALQSSNESQESVRKGQQAVATMIEAMKNINDNNDSFSEFMKKNSDELKEMVNVITNISEKTKVINDIVFQTKLLSFNASVEAARAGEQGKGFAVVAEEVGNLAQMSGNAANEIKGLLEDSIEKVNEIVSKTKTEVEHLVSEGKLKIEAGVVRAKDCDAALLEISSAVSKAESLIKEVSLASHEQSQGINEVNKAMGQIDEVTNQNSASASKVSDSAALVMQLSHSVKQTSDKLVHLLQGQVVLNVTQEKPKTSADKKVETSKSPKINVEPKRSATPVLKIVKGVTSTKKETVQPEAPRKKSMEATLPSYDDKRFEDV